MLVIYHGETPLVNCGPRSIFYIWNTIYCNHLLSAFPTSNFHLPHYTFNTLWSASRWDWQPHCYVGAKFLGCVVHKCWLKFYWFDNLGFFSEGRLAATLIIPSSWGLPTDMWSARIKHIFWRCCQGFEAPPVESRQQHIFSGAVAGDLKHHLLSPVNNTYFLTPLPPSSRLYIHQVAARVVSHFQPFKFVIVLLSLLLLCVVFFLYQKSKKNSYLFFILLFRILSKWVLLRILSCVISLAQTTMISYVLLLLHLLHLQPFMKSNLLC